MITVTQTPRPPMHYQRDGTYVGSITFLDVRTVETDAEGVVISDETVVVGGPPGVGWLSVPTAPANANRDTWNGSQWVTDATLVDNDREALATNALNDAIHKTIRDVLYDMENRVRALEGRQAVSLSVFTKALKGIVKGYVS